MSMFSYLTVFLMLVVPLTHGQERTAAGALDTQMTWTALKSLVDAASTKTDAVNSRVDQIEKCAEKDMLYAPNDAAATNGCKPVVSLQTRIESIEKCGRKGMLYAPGATGVDSDGCKAQQDTSLRWSIGARHLATHPLPVGYNNRLPACGDYVRADAAMDRAVAGNYVNGNKHTFAGSRCSTKGIKCRQFISSQMANDNGNNGSYNEVVFTCD